MKNKRANNRGQRQAKHALAQLERQLTGPSLSADSLSSAFKEYLAMKLQKKAGALTFLDVEPALFALHVDATLVAEVRDLLSRFETWQYAGISNTAQDMEQIRAKTLDVAKRLENYLP